MNILTTTFSPAMLKAGCKATVKETTLAEIKAKVKYCKSAVGHEITAAILSALLEQRIDFNRVNLSLDNGDCLYVVIPKFRANEAREFTHEEVTAAGFRCFFVEVLA